MSRGKGVSRRGFLKGAAGVAPVLLATPRHSEAEKGPLSAGVMVMPEVVHSLPRTQYGHFIEHLGRCIKGGIWAEGESEDMFLGGVRWELVEAIRSIHPPLIRYPGGCFADGYHWQDGIGPRESRPRRKNLAWGKFGPLVGPEEDNHFGTDEFCQLCEAVGAEPMLTVNVGSGTAEEAAAWVEYCNGSAETRWGQERARNSHPDPYRVKYWFIGNEIFGRHEIGWQTPEQYVHTLHAYSRAMRAVDADIKLIAVGGAMPGSALADANRIVLQGAGELVDYISLHQYVPPVNLRTTLSYGLARLETSSLKSVYYDILGTLLRMQFFLEHNCREIRTYSPPGHKVVAAFDEWNLWFNFIEDVIQNNYNLRDGLWTASMFHLFHRHAPDVPIANIAQMVNCLGIITSTRRGTFLTPSALAFKLYTEHAGEELLASSVDCPPLPHESGLPSLDLSATRTGDKVSLFLINRHYDAELLVSCQLAGMSPTDEIRRYEIYHPNPAQYNTYRAPEAVSIEKIEPEAEMSRQGGKTVLSFRLKPHSLTCLEFRTAGA